MHRSLRLKVTLWFLLVLAAVVGAAWLGYRQLAHQIRSEAEAQMRSKTDHVLDVLSATNSTYLDLVHSSMRVLKMEAARMGPASLRTVTAADGRATEELFFGSTPMTNAFDLVDEVKSIMGGTATIFIKRGDGFVRIATNVQRPDGSRAVGTQLDPEGKAIAAIRQGEAFYGVVDILGKPFITGYDPIRDADGETIGVYYVGYALETLSAVRDALNDRGILENGFFALLDPQDQVIFQTQGTSRTPDVDALIHQAHGSGPANRDWVVRSTEFAPWDYEVVTAMFLPDVTRVTLDIIGVTYGITGVVILAVLLVSYWLATRLSTTLEEAEISRLEAVEARDSAESANRTKSTFLANMSHELRTPMNAIIGYSEMLIEEAEDLEQDEFIPDLQKIRSAGKHLLALINDILDLSKIEAGKMTIYAEEFSIREMIDDAIATIRPLVEKNANHIEIRMSPEIGAMHADLTKVRQALFNLLSNASKFTEKGVITLTVERVVQQSGERIRMSVADTGIGMTPEQLGRLFQAFSQADASTTRKYGGTGLGLIISRKFCQMMGGDISVTSEAGVGTTFTVDLPVDVESRSEPSATIPSQAASTGAKRRVLVIDDDPDASELIGRMLRKNGFDVLLANSGPKGIELARTEKPDAITLDVMMPGMDGWSVLTTLKSDKATAAIPVVMVTMLQDRPLGFALGADDYLTKPVDADKLRAVLSKHAGKPGAEVLVVEDDANNRDMLVRILKKEGLAVAEAENGSAALEMLATLRPAVILLDLMMPVMDGFEFLQILRQNPELADIPIIVVTAKDLTGSDRAQLNGSVQDIIQKGAMDRDKLLREVCDMIAKSEKKS